MIRGNTSDFIDHPLPKHFVSHMGPPTTPGPQASRHLYPALAGHIDMILFLSLCL